MTVRVNRAAVYAVTQSSSGSAEAVDNDNLIPISADVSKTFLTDNSVERPELKGTFGANDSVIISQTQGISIPSFIQGGGLSTKAVKLPPVDPLLRACFHKANFMTKEGATENDESNAIYVRYVPSDDDPTNGGATVLYQLDGLRQQMINALGTMSLGIEVGSFATHTFEMQSPYAAPSKEAAPTGGTKPTFQEAIAVSGKTTFSLPSLPDEFSNCVRSFSLTQNATISEIDCATKAGNRDITYTQTARASTGEITFDMDEDKVVALSKIWGGGKALSTPFAHGSGTPTALVRIGNTNGNTLFIGSHNYKVGAPTAGDSDGIATWTFPITFIPDGNNPDYELVYMGNPD